MAKQEYLYTLAATARNDQGKGASRRLRHQGLVPAIVYGAGAEPQPIAIKQDELLKNAKNESFFSQIINLKIEGQEDTEVLVRDVQHHLFKPLFMHFDFQRIVRGQELNATIALHFLNEENCPGVKNDGGIVSHSITSIDVTCRPSALPEYIAVDMANAEMGDIIHMGNLVLPEGVRLAGEWTEEELAETTVAHVMHPQLETNDDDEDTDNETEAEAEASEDEDKENKEDKE